MKNIEIKKEILELINNEYKYIKSYNIEVNLCCLKEKLFNKIYFFIVSYGNHNPILIKDIGYGESFEKALVGTKENIRILKQEQKNMYRYLSNHFKNVSMIEIKETNLINDNRRRGNELKCTERNKKIIEFREQGKTFKAIGEIFNISKQRVQIICSNFNKNNITRE